MSYSLKASGATFTSYIDKTVPYLTSASGLWLFGTDEALSCANLVPDSASPTATIVGTGDPAYGDGYVDMTIKTGHANNASFDTGISLPIVGSFTYIAVATAAVGVASDAQSVCGNTPIGGSLNNDIMQSTSGAVVARYGGGGTLTRGTVAPGTLAFMASTKDASGNKAVYLHDGTTLNATTGTGAANGTLSPYIIGPLMAGNTAVAAISRHAANMLFPIALTSSQLLEVYDYLKFKLNKRGITVL